MTIRNGFLLCAGAGLLVFGRVGWCATEIQMKDTNGDGRNDREITYENGVKSIEKKDLDSDGFFETTYFYDKKGRLRRKEVDTNRDGKPDKWYFFEKGGAAVLKEYDLNFDGKVDKRKKDELGVDRITKTQRFMTMWREEDTDFDGIIDLYRVKGVKSPSPDKKGQPMDPNPRVNIEEAPGKESVPVSVWNVEKMVKERAEKEDLHESP